MAGSCNDSRRRRRRRRPRCVARNRKEWKEKKDGQLAVNVYSAFFFPLRREHHHQRK